MLYKLHYFCMAAANGALSLLLGVYLKEYIGASEAELGLIYMLMPFTGLIFRPIICSFADRRRAHREVLIWCQLLTALLLLPYIIVPFLGPNIYRAQSRSCWYILVAANILGDIAINGAVSLGDSLAMNYANRIGVDFGTYRIWDTISWMMFGLTSGTLNEVWFLPNYVASFMVFVLVSLLDAFVFFLWPKDYFVMVKASAIDVGQSAEKRSARTSWFETQTASLMPKSVVWAHAKKQLRSLITFESCCKRRDRADDTEIKQTTAENWANQQAASGDKAISMRVQLQTLLLLIRRDLRIVLYLIMFIAAGAVTIPVRFFYTSLSDRCRVEDSCNFSQLAGYVQMAMGVVEPILFVYIKTITQTIGRLNTLTICFALTFFKFLFYSTVWPQLDPHWALVSELCDGVFFVVFITLIVEMCHLFAGEVELLIPELLELGVISEADEKSLERLKVSLPATMLALVAGVCDGMGRGVFALVYGLIVDAYSYEALWIIVTIISFASVLGLQLAAAFERFSGRDFSLNRIKSTRTVGRAEHSSSLPHAPTALE